MVSARAVADAIVDYLDGTSGIAAYMSRGPTPPRGKTVVVHPTGGEPTGPLGAPDRDLRVEFQSTSVGLTPEQALWVHDQVVARLLRAVVSVGGVDTHEIWEIPGTARPVMRDDDLADPLFYATCSWMAHARP